VDCQGLPLIDATEMRRRGLPLPGERDTRRFVRAGTAEDPLSAQRFASVLEAAGIPFLLRPGRTSVGAITTPSTMPWWEILVAEEQLATAGTLLANEQAQVEAGAEERGHGLVRVPEADDEGLGVHGRPAGCQTVILSRAGANLGPPAGSVFGREPVLTIRGAAVTYPN
jgi:hypothetical protein